MDDHVDKVQAKGISQAIDRVPNRPQRWHTALTVQARNLSSGAAVWSSPVLPKTKDEMETLLIEARSKALIELKRAGFFE